MKLKHHVRLELAHRRITTVSLSREAADRRWRLIVEKIRISQLPNEYLGKKALVPPQSSAKPAGIHLRALSYSPPGDHKIRSEADLHRRVTDPMLGCHSLILYADVRLKDD